MPYVINNRNSDTIIIPDEGLNQDYSIDLVGRNYPNYGSIIATSFVDLLDNFASSTEPAKATDGQLWYDKTNRMLRLRDGSTGAWIPQSIIVSPTVPSNQFSQNQAGTAYFNTSESTFYVHDGINFKESSIPAGVVSTTGSYSGTSIGGTPTQYGSRLRHMFLVDTAGVKRSVLAVVYSNSLIHLGGDYFDQEKIIAIFSGHADIFEAADADSDISGTTHNFYNQLRASGGIGTTIRPGINVRSDDQGRVNFAEISERANAAYNLNTGEFGAEGANITASNVYHKNDNIISNDHNTHTLGASATTFSEAYITDWYVGVNGGQGNIFVNGTGTVNIGTVTTPFNNVYVSNIIIEGDIIKEGDGGDLGSENNYFDNLYVTNAYITEANIDGYRMPTVIGNTNDMMVLGGTGNVIFKEQPQRVGTVESDLSSIDISVQSTDVVDTENDITLTTNDYTIDVNKAFVHGLFGIANTSNLSYTISPDGNQAIFDLTKTTEFDGWEPSDFVFTRNPPNAETQQITGHKSFTQRVNLDAGLTFGAVDHEIQFANNLGFKLTTDAEGENRFAMYSNGDFFASGDVTAFRTIQQLSDRRVKKNLKKINGALGKVKSLTGYTYSRSDKLTGAAMRGPGQRETGLIAQDVQKVLPEAVKKNPQGLLSVAYGNMVGLLIESVKELSKKVDQLQSEVNTLKGYHD